MESKTVAEVFDRLVAKRDCDSKNIADVFGHLGEALSDCKVMDGCPECRKKWYGFLAEMIEEDKAKAVSAAMERTMAEQMAEWAEDNGLPAFNYGEDFGQWLHRCFLELPRYADGEPVYFGDGTDKLHGVEKFIYLRSGECCQMQDAAGNIQNVYPGDRVKLPAPKVLGADGKPIEAGETVYIDESHASKAANYDFNAGPESFGLLGVSPNDALVVASAEHFVRGRRFVLFKGEGHAWCPASWLTHKEPDTQERIDADAREHTFDYWGCVGYGCKECPSKVDGETPMERFGVGNCSEAKCVDLLCRQRELDSRKGGAK